MTLMLFPCSLFMQDAAFLKNFMQDAADVRNLSLFLMHDNFKAS
jgi:hypothetical protein